MKKIMSLIVIVLSFSALLIGCGEERQSSGGADKPVEGIEVKLDIITNNKSFDEGIFQATITNTTDNTFSGVVHFVNTTFISWDVEVVNLPPGKSLTRELKTKYIAHPEDGYSYRIEGNFDDNSYTSKVDYEVVNNVEDRSFKIRTTENITKETALEIVKELYSIYGEGMLHVGIYDEAQDIEDIIPRAEYFGNLVSKTITINSEDGSTEQFDFETN